MKGGVKMMWKNRRAQAAVEYAVVITVVIAALLVMQIYMKRGISGKLRQSTDQIGDQFTPYSATYALTKTHTGGRKEDTTAKGKITSNSLENSPEKQGRTGTEEPVNTEMTDETLFFKKQP